MGASCPDASGAARALRHTRWCWSQLGDLSLNVTSGSRDWAEHYSNEGAIFVRMGNLSRNSYRLRLDKIQRVAPPLKAEGERTRLESGDLLISITCVCWAGVIRVPGIVDRELRFAWITLLLAIVKGVAANHQGIEHATRMHDPTASPARSQ